MKINDKLTQSVAEAVKEVTGHKIAEARMKELHGHIADGKSPEEIIAAMKLKSSPDMIEFIKGLMETEVQDSDKDFVDLHSVDGKEDPEQKKYTEETEVEDEDEVEEGNEFTAAAAKAKLAGKDEFEFEGKTYPVEIEQDAAEKILGKKESTDLEEAAKFWTVTITKKAGKLFKGQTVDVKASNSAEAIKKGLKQMKVDNPMTVPSGSVDAVLAESLKEAAKPSNGKSTIDIDVVDAKAAMKDMSKFKLKAKAGSDDELIVTGKNVDIFKYLTSQAYGMDTDDIEEFYPELYESVDLEEATMSQGVKTAATQIYSLEKSLKVGSNLNKGINKSLEGKYDADFKKMQKAIGDIITVWEEIERDFSDMNESADLEEAVTPADFVKGGDAKITKREVDGMLSKLFIDTKLAKAVESNSAFKAGEKSNGTKNPYKKDTADFHLFILGQQSADAGS